MSNKHAHLFDTFELPDGWVEHSLRDVADVRFSNVDKKTVAGEKPVRLCNYTDVYNNSRITEDIDFMRATATEVEIQKFGLNVGDIMLTKDSETPFDIGISALCAYSAADLVCGYHLALLKTQADKVDPEFLNSQLGNSRIARFYSRAANGVTRYGLSTDAIGDVLVPMPIDLNEQRAISAILNTMDEAIRRTETLIAKLQKIKAGLLHDLLTRGLDEHGQLRDPHRHPEQFKDSEIGSIPKEWNVKKLIDVAAVRFSNVDKKTRSKERLVRLCNYTDVYNNRYLSGSGAYMVASATESQIRTFGIHKGDILLTKDSETPDDIGVPSVIMDDPDNLVCGYHLAHIRPNQSEVVPIFLAAHLSTWQAARYFGKNANGMTRYGLSTSAVESTPVPVPPTLYEQEVIAGCLVRQEDKINILSGEARKLRKQRHGLMQELLTGCVRVSDGTVECQKCEHKGGAHGAERAVPPESLRQRDPLQA